MTVSLQESQRINRQRLKARRKSKTRGELTNDGHRERALNTLSRCKLLGRLFYIDIADVDDGPITEIDLREGDIPVEGPLYRSESHFGDLFENDLDEDHVALAAMDEDDLEFTALFCHPVDDLDMKIGAI